MNIDISMQSSNVLVELNIINMMNNNMTQTCIKNNRSDHDIRTSRLQMRMSWLLVEEWRCCWRHLAKMGRSTRRRRQRYAALSGLNVRWAIMEVISNHTKACPKNRIRSLSVQNHRGVWFQKSTLPIVGAHICSVWRNYNGGASTKRGKS
jgi:hypothetical protein